MNAGDEGPDKLGVAVLTHRFWTSALGEGAIIAVLGIIVGAAAGIGLSRVVGAFVGNTNAGDPVAITWRRFSSRSRQSRRRRGLARRLTRNPEPGTSNRRRLHVCP